MSSPGDIPLGIRTPAPPASPLDTIGALSQVQDRLNQIRLFNQTYSARQQAGEILASSPDLDTAVTRMKGNPQVAGFLPEIMNTVQGLNLATQQTRAAHAAALGAESDVNTTALKDIMQGLTSGVTDSSSFDNTINARLKTKPAEVRQAIGGSVAALKSSLFDDLPADPKQSQAEYQNRLNAVLLGAGFTPETIAGLTSKAGILNVGSAQVPYTQQPGITGGNVNYLMPQQIQNTLPRQVIQGTGPEGQPITTVVGGGPAGGPSGNALVPRAASGQVAARGGSGNALMTGPTASQAQYLTHRGADIADYEKNLDDNVSNGATLRKNVGEVVAAAHDATMGGGAEAYSKLGSALQAIGIKNSTVDKWANGSLAASQVIDKVALQNSMAQLKQQLTGVGGSRMNAQEFVAYMNKNPNLTTDPRAAVQIFNLWQQFYDKNKTEQNALDAFKRGKLTGDKGIDAAAGGDHDLSRWPSLWNQSDFMRGFAPTGPISGAGVRGTGNVVAGATHRYDPASGRIVPINQ